MLYINNSTRSRSVILFLIRAAPTLIFSDTGEKLFNLITFATARMLEEKYNEAV